MTASFIALLTAYYFCDAAATLHPMAPGTAQGCAASYEAVKSAFRDGAGPAERQAAYLRFKDWETRNDRLVQRMRARAAENARSALIGAPI